MGLGQGDPKQVEDWVWARVIRKQVEDWVWARVKECGGPWTPLSETTLIADSGTRYSNAWNI